MRQRRTRQGRQSRYPHTTPGPNGGPGAPTSTLPLSPMLGAAEARNVTVEFLENSKTSPWRALINPWKKQPQTQPEKAMEVKLGHFMVALLTALESAGGTGKLTETIATAGSTLPFGRRVVLSRDTDTVCDRVNSI